VTTGVIPEGRGRHTAQSDGHHRARLPRILLGLLVVSVLLSPLRRELYVGDETKYTQVVREMRAGSFFLPTLHGSPFTHKPPVHFWIAGALTYAFGVYSIWPFVLPSIVAFVLLLWLMHRFAGPLAAFVSGTSLMLWGSAQTARMDVEFTLLLALAAYLLFRDRVVLAGVAAGVATLIKGPMAPVIIIALFVFESIRKKRRPRWSDALGLIALIVIPLLWFVPALIIGGEAFWREIFFKQTVGRAVGAWVHRSPPWFYLVRSPLTLMPWFFLLIPAIVTAVRGRDERAKFGLNWILSVFVPYTLLSSKLDVYMITLLPAVGLVIARYVESCVGKWGRRGNLVMLALLALIGLAGSVMPPPDVPDGELLRRLDVRALFAIVLVASIVAIVITLRAHLAYSVYATGFVLVAALAYVGVALAPLANEMASTRPLVRAVAKQNVRAENIACFVCPHLWIRGMEPSLFNVRYVDARTFTPDATVVVTRRKDAQKIDLRGYRKVDELRMIGKWFDVYRR
jgi:4-amino-4-deoxy-L-arabinose transferase-like glycosyltransferase